MPQRTQYAVAVHDGVQAVRDGQHRAVGKGGGDGGLDKGVCGGVHVAVGRQKKERKGRDQE
jgi:hypothetical protein